MTPDESQRLASVETKLDDLKENLKVDRQELREDLNRNFDSLKVMHKQHFDDSKIQGEKLIELTGMCNNAMLVANGAMSEAKQGSLSLQTHKDTHAKWNKIAGISAAGLTGTGGALAALKDVIKNWLQ